MQTMVDHSQIQRTRKGSLASQEKGRVGKNSNNQSPFKEAGGPKYEGFSLVGLLQSLTGWAIQGPEKFSSFPRIVK